MDDHAIIALFFARDERAVEEFRRAFGKLCLGIALSITGDEGTAEECLNDACLRLWNAIPPENPRSLKAYGAKITRNLALGRLEKDRAAKRSAVLEEFDETAERANVSFEEDFIESEALAQAIDRFLASRSKIEAAVFVRRYFSGESAKEISRATGLGEVKIARMLKKLRTALAAALAKGGFEV